MKKTCFLLLTLLLLLGCVLFSAHARGETLLVGEGTDTKIVLPDGETPQAQYAAKVMQEYIEKIIGRVLPITPQSEAQTQLLICSDPALEEGAYSIRATENGLCISGGGMRGTIYGVFAFFEQVCGVRYYTNEAFLIPQSEEILVPADYALDYKLFFEYSETDWHNGLNSVFTVANNISGGNMSLTPDEMGGCTYYYHACYVHSLSTVFCNADTYFDSHPEYFALHDGKRSRRQLCLSNPDVLELVTQEALDFLKTHNNPTHPLEILTVSQNDNQDYCACEACAALDEANGSHAGSMLTFVNSVADAVKEAGYDNVAIDTLAYEYTRKAPSDVRPHENVIVRLCPIECCYGHAFDDPDCEENASFSEDLRDWAKICDRLYIWDYGTNYSEYLCFFPNLHVMQRNMQFFYENNVKGVYGQGNSQLAWCNGEFCDLRLYLQTKLMQNPYCDFEREMNSFLAFYYGDGWQGIRDFIDFCCDKETAWGKHVSIYEHATGSMRGVSISDVKRMDENWEKAKSGAKNETQLHRVIRSQFCWRYWKCANLRGEFSLLHTPYQRMHARDELYLDLVAAGTTILGETNRKRELSDCYALHLMFVPFRWTTLYDSGFWDFISPAVVWVYHTLGKIESVFRF